MFKCKRDFTCRALKWTFSRVTRHIWRTKDELNTLVLCWFGQWHSLWKTKQPLILNLYCPICVEFELMKLRKIIHGVWSLSRDTYLVNTRNYPSLVLPHSVVQEASVRIGIKGSWRLWFGKWVLYFHRMLHITNQVLAVLWHLTLSAKIGGHVTWVVCY